MCSTKKYFFSCVPDRHSSAMNQIGAVGEIQGILKYGCRGGTMLGWHISVYRQKSGGLSPGTALTPKGTRLAVWQTGLGGLDWLDELVKTGQAINLGDNGGYPCRYTATAERLMPHIIDTPPGARSRWALGLGDIVSEKWQGRTVIDREALAGCPAKEWLLVEAWDES
jgi:hypothetical protein